MPWCSTYLSLVACQKVNAQFYAEHPYGVGHSYAISLSTESYTLVRYKKQMWRSCLPTSCWSTNLCRTSISSEHPLLLRNTYCTPMRAIFAHLWTLPFSNAGKAQTKLRVRFIMLEKHHARQQRWRQRASGPPATKFTRSRCLGRQIYMTSANLLGV